MTRHYRKATISITLLVVVLGLVSLGTKLPNLQEVLSASGKPKPRPRAVVKNQIKTCNETIKKLNAHSSPGDFVRNYPPPALGVISLSLHVIPSESISCIIVSCKPSRASPSPLILS